MTENPICHGSPYREHRGIEMYETSEDDIDGEPDGTLYRCSGCRRVVEIPANE